MDVPREISREVKDTICASVSGQRASLQSGAWIEIKGPRDKLIRTPSHQGLPGDLRGNPYSIGPPPEIFENLI